MDGRAKWDVSQADKRMVDDGPWMLDKTGGRPTEPHRQKPKKVCEGRVEQSNDGAESDIGLTPGGHLRKLSP